jgi:uncharacterized integral membrane protein (TIGR00698 family)
MTTQRREFLSGLALTVMTAGAALGLARVPGLGHLGPLSIALLLGLVWRATGRVPEEWRAGVDFAAKRLLRIGIILLGVRLNLELVAQAGPRILLLDATVVTTGLLGISWLGRRLGLDPVLACLIAVDSSICGASAVAAAAPTLRARDADVALVIPLCSLIGTAAMLAYTFVQHQWALSPVRYGMMAGGTLHEVAQVMAALAPFPDAVEIGTVTKLTRVVLLVPVVLVLGRIFAHRRRGEAGGAASVVPKPWFVLGFLLVGVVNTLACRGLPAWGAEIAAVDGRLLDVTGWLMAAAMAGMGLQVDFARLRANGLRAVGTAIGGWVMLAGLAAGEVWWLTR